MGFMFKLCKESKNIEHYIANDNASISQLLEAFEDFLRGCGYGFSGVVDLIELPEVEFHAEEETKEN